jgi:hypothetical protein
MSKILIKESHTAYWFERLSLISYYSESDFEKRLVDQSSALFEDYFVIPFKKTISHVNDIRATTTPDLAFIKRDYSSWLLVEVELKGHTYEHVKAQVDIMRKPHYNAAEVTKYILGKASHILDPPSFTFDEPLLAKLINSEAPKVLVIVDETHKEWEAQLKKINVLLCVIQMYKNGTGEEIMRIKGQYPRIFTGTVHCKIAKDPANALEVINSHELIDKKNTGDLIDIYLNDSLTKWAILKTKTKKCYLKCIGPIFPIAPKKDLTLEFDEHNNAYIFQNN